MNPRAARTFYRLLVTAAAPALRLWLRRRGQRDGDPRFYPERCGRGYRALSGAAPLWIHCASVGEVRTARPWIEYLLERVERPVLVTTATATGAGTVAQLFDTRVHHAYLPFDWPGAVARFFETYRPALGAVLETELWPYLYAEASARGVPLLLINARLSSRSQRAGSWVQALQRQALACVTRVLARSESDAARFRALGVESERVETVGSLKLAPLALHAPQQPADWRSDRPWFVAASTHDDEERRVASAFRTAARTADAPETLLIVVPRHPHRGPEVAEALQADGHRVAVRSRGDSPVGADVYVADTIGELDGWMAEALGVFVGGSLIPHGGQNVVEPARLGRAIVFGPHMENFEEEVTRLLEVDGAWQVADDDALTDALRTLLDDPMARARLGARALEAVQASRTGLERYAEAVLEHLPEHR